MKIVDSESKFSKWFEKNFKRLGYSKIIRRDNGRFPDYIMLKKNKEVRVELETISSNFILHKHDKNKVDEVVCIKKDVELGVPIKEVKELKYIPSTVRVSATVDESTVNIIKILLKKGKYRNKSHVIEEAIKQMTKKKRK